MLATVTIFNEIVTGTLLGAKRLNNNHWEKKDSMETSLGSKSTHVLSQLMAQMKETSSEMHRGVQCDPVSWALICFQIGFLYQNYWRILMLLNDVLNLLLCGS